MRADRFFPVFGFISLACSSVLPAGEIPFRIQEIETWLKVGYAVRLSDVNGDGRRDIVVVDATRVVWYENPGWQRHTIIENQTKADNVCIAPHDVDGDGKIDFALGADWRPFDTKTGGTIQWVRQGPSLDQPWTVVPIAEEPMVHRMHWVDLEGNGRMQLVVVPLMGRGAAAPDWLQHAVRVLAFSVSKDPAREPWPVNVLNEDLHVTHNFCPTDLDHDGRIDILAVSFEGVSVLQRSDAGTWKRTLIGRGNQETSPNRGASEIKHGRLAGGGDYVATIEPWHGFQVVVYTRPQNAEAKTDPSEKAAELWQRHVIDEQLQWGHGVWCANLDEDDDEELIIGVRDHKNDEYRSGVRIYDPQDRHAAAWQRQIVDPGGVQIEDLAADDLDNDGRIDIVAAGRQTHNVRIYWNEGKGARAADERNQEASAQAVVPGIGGTCCEPVSRVGPALPSILSWLPLVRYSLIEIGRSSRWARSR